MSVLVFGRSGQVASELARQLPDATFLDRDQADLSDPDACAEVIRLAEPETVINAAAWTGVDLAEDEPETAHRVNADAPGAMARACAKLDAPFIHISTDYVFDGSGQRPWAPQDPTGPLGVYGASKLAGERAVAQANDRSVVLRTSWVFSAHGSNFVKTMLRLADTRDSLGIVADQIGGPTPAAAIAAACIRIAGFLRDEPSSAGIYHFSGAPDVSWAGFAREIFRQAEKDVTVTDLSTSDYPTRAPRPANSRLDCSSTEKVFGIERPDWRVELAAVLAELKAGGRA